jgi:hypothetical protein
MEADSDLTVRGELLMHLKAIRDEIEAHLFCEESLGTEEFRAT